MRFRTKLPPLRTGFDGSFPADDGKNKARRSWVGWAGRPESARKRKEIAKKAAAKRWKK